MKIGNAIFQGQASSWPVKTITADLPLPPDLSQIDTIALALYPKSKSASITIGSDPSLTSSVTLDALSVPEALSLFFALCALLPLEYPPSPAPSKSRSPISLDKEQSNSQ